MEGYSGVVLKAYSASAAVMVCSNVSRGRRQGVGKVGLGGWSGDQVDGSSGAWGHGSGGGGDGGSGSVGQADEADGEVAQGGHDLGAVGGAQLVAVLVEDDVSHPVEAVVRVGRGRGAVVSEGRLPRPLVRTRRAGFPAPGSA